MMTWPHSAPSNQTVQTPLHPLQDEDSPSDLLGLLEEETLEFQEEYPQEEAEEAEDSLLQYLHNKLLTQEINSSAIRRLHSQETA